MRLAITEKCFDDLASLPKDVNKKCRDLLRELRSADPRTVLDRGLPGWRLHKLKSSPFRSASVDMQYRVLLKIEGDILFVHRIVKHDLADSPHVNRNDSAGELCEVSPLHLRIDEVAKALDALGIPAQFGAALAQARDEDGLLLVLGDLPADWAAIALELYELQGVSIPKAKYTLIRHDEEFERALDTGGFDWQIYLHPSQAFIVELPSHMRAVVYGSAGTGKTVCAWHRIAELTRRGLAVGFICPSSVALDVSRSVLNRLLGTVDSRCYFLVPGNPEEILQLAAAADHIVIDEGQEFRPGWYTQVAADERLAGKGLTVFSDLNQILGSVSSSSSNRRERYKEMMEAWRRILVGQLRCVPLSLTINYRNSREIADFYFELLNRSLLVSIAAEAPAFSAGDVLKCTAPNVDAAAKLVQHFLSQLKDDCETHAVAVISLLGGGSRRILLDALGRSQNFYGAGLAEKLVFSSASHIRGHERRVVIALLPPIPEVVPNPRRAIDAYIVLSRARDVLIVIEVRD